MRPDYKSWIPVNFIIIPLLSTIILFGILLYLCTGAVLSGTYLYWAAGICSILCFLSGAVFIWSVLARRAFSYHGGRQLMKRIVEGIAAYVQIPAGGTCLDVGCGSGALTVACAKKIRRHDWSASMYGTGSTAAHFLKPCVSKTPVPKARTTSTFSRAMPEIFPSPTKLLMW